MVALPSALRTRLDATVELILGRIRGALDLPSRTELADLTQRLEELDRRIGALAAERVAEMTVVAPALPEPEAPEPDAPAPVIEAAADERPTQPEAIPAPAQSRRNARRNNAPHRARRK